MQTYRPSQKLSPAVFFLHTKWQNNHSEESSVYSTGYYFLVHACFTYVCPFIIPWLWPPESILHNKWFLEHWLVSYFSLSFGSFLTVIIISICLSLLLHSNLSNTDTKGTEQSVCIRELSVVWRSWTLRHFKGSINGIKCSLSQIWPKQVFEVPLLFCWLKTNDTVIVWAMRQLISLVVTLWCVTTNMKSCWIRTVIIGVSIIERINLYEFSPWGRDFVSLVRIIEGPYCGGYFYKECMCIFPEPNE